MSPFTGPPPTMPPAEDRSALPHLLARLAAAALRGCTATSAALPVAKATTDAQRQASPSRTPFCGTCTELRKDSLEAKKQVEVWRQRAMLLEDHLRERGREVQVERTAMAQMLRTALSPVPKLLSRGAASPARSALSPFRAALSQPSLVNVGVTAASAAPSASASQMAGVALLDPRAPSPGPGASWLDPRAPSPSGRRTSGAPRRAQTTQPHVRGGLARPADATPQGRGGGASTPSPRTPCRVGMACGPKDAVVGSPDSWSWPASADWQGGGIGVVYTADVPAATKGIRRAPASRPAASAAGLRHATTSPQLGPDGLDRALTELRALVAPGTAAA